MIVVFAFFGGAHTPQGEKTKRAAGLMALRLSFFNIHLWIHFGKRINYSTNATSAFAPIPFAVASPDWASAALI